MPVREVDEQEDFSPMPPQIPRISSTPPVLGSRALTPEARVQPPEPKEFELRPGDSGEDRPTQIPQQLEPLTDADLKAIQAAEETALLREMREAEELLASEPSLFGLPAIISHPFLGATVIAFASVLGLFIFNQVTSVLNGLATLPAYWQYAGWAGLGILGLAFSYAGLRFAWLYVRLRRNKQLRIKGLEELEKRTRNALAGQRQDQGSQTATHPVSSRVSNVSRQGTQTTGRPGRKR